MRRDGDKIVAGESGTPAYWLWAKTSRPSGEIASSAWHPLAAHLVDTTLVAHQLWDRWLSPSTKRWLTEPLGDDQHARALFALLAGCHDLGKATPAFQIQVTWLHAQLRNAGLAVDQPLPNRTKAPHALASAATVRPLLVAHGWTNIAIDGFAAILGGHHGWFPRYGYEREPESRPELYGRPARRGRSVSGDPDPWGAARQNLFNLIVEIASATDVLTQAREIELGSARRLTLTGFVILADWIASNEHLFPYYCAPYDDDYLQVAEERAANALSQLGWHGAANLGTVVGAPAFERRFGFSPNALQRQTLDAVEDSEGGLVLIEAPMGMGKTEAALAGAEVLASRHGHGGAFIGLPTQATSNQMFHRTKRWLEQLGSGTFVLELAHGRAQQVPEFRDLLEHGAPSAVDVDEEETARVTAEAWFAGPKRRLLAPFVVGTIDQVLLGAAKVRHVALRHVGLAGKVVILDEVHAYDAYMSVFLRRILEWLGAERIPVILLSATLPPVVRTRLIEAYAGHFTPLGPVGYPSITTVSTDGQVTTTPVATDASSVTVHLDEDPDDESSPPLLELVATMAETGANILVIRNTVARAQQTYRAIAERRPKGTVHLLHARFTAADRLKKESWLAEHFGRGAKRPFGQVVVGTQVLEQSLDIDFEVLVTDLAPVDLVFQRIGRVHRHPGARRPDGFAQPRVILTGFVRTATGSPAFPSGSVRVYGEHLLLRTAALLLDRGSLTLPDDVPTLVAAVYGDDDVIAPAWHDHAARVAADWRRDQHERERRAEQFVISDPTSARDLLELDRIGLGDIADDDDPRVQAAVRDSVASIEVAIAFADPSPNVPRFGETEVSLELPPQPEDVEAVLGSVVRLPSYLTEAANSLVVPTGWRTHPWLRRQRVLVVDRDGESSLGDYSIRYTDEKGLEVLRDGA